MQYTDLIFDLYGTLVDIHTEESAEVWKKTALYFGFYGADYTGAELKAAFEAALSDRKAQAGQSYECFPDIPFEQIMSHLFCQKSVTHNVKELGFHAAQLFRILSIDHLRVYPGAKEALQALHLAGFRLWLLSNAQRAFTGYELKALKLDDVFDGIYISSDYECRKPDTRFFHALLDEKHLEPSHCLMIGNDRQTDIAGAHAAGLDTLYMHTDLTPQDQAPADPHLALDTAHDGRYEFEGDDWTKLYPLLFTKLSENNKPVE